MFGPLTKKLSRLSAAAAVTAGAALIASLAATTPAIAQDQTRSRFSDVPQGVHSTAIDALDELHVFDDTLCGEDRFCPDRPIDRIDMAVWLIRALDNAEPGRLATSRFADVDADQWWAPYVERLAELEITDGCRRSPLRYCPDEFVTRDRMASFLVRAFDQPQAGAFGFVDIAGNFHEANINALAATGITQGCNRDPLSYCPTSRVKRSQMATFLHRAFNLLTFETVSSGGGHSCGIRGDDTIRCWGRNQWGQATALQGTFEAVSAGETQTCGLRTDQTIQCWGDNGFGQTSAPSGAFIAVSAGLSHSCGVRTNDWIQCWGRNQWLQREAPQGTYRAVSAGGGHSCGLRTDDTVRCWGLNHDRQAAAPRGSFRAVSAGGSHSCGIRADRTVQCWGTNNWGERSAPAGTFSGISLGARHSCGLQTNGTIRCWGHNNFGQTDAPQGVFSAVSSGEEHTCAIGSDERVYCWGRDNGGQASRPG